MILGVAHTTLVVNDYEEAKNFYCKKLGFILVEDTQLEKKRWVRLRAPGGQGSDILLSKAIDEKQAACIGNQAGGTVLFFLHTNNFDADYEKFHSMGVQFVEGPANRSYGKVAVFEDLYGNRIDLIQQIGKDSKMTQSAPTPHTFLAKPGHWKALGKFWDESGKEYPASGETTITHGETSWKNEGKMIIHKDENIVFENKYEIQPFLPGRDSTGWTSSNPAIGNMTGHFCIVGDAITSIYESGDGKYKGHEVMIQKSDVEYAAIGTFFSNGEKLSSWGVSLRRTQEP